MNDYVEELERQVKDLEKLLSYCKENNIDKNIVFVITALSVKKKDKLIKLIKY